MVTTLTPEGDGTRQSTVGAVITDLEQRAPMPDCRCSENSSGSGSDSNTVSLGGLLSSGSDGSPTITMTKTLYSAGETTSTRSESSTSIGGIQGTTVSALSLDAAPFMGVAVTSTTSSTQANPTTDGTVTMTGTSTIYHTITVTSTSISTTTEHDSSFSTALISLIGSNSTSHTASTSTNTHSSKPSTSSAGSNSQSKTYGGTVAGATMGSMAALAMIGLLLWFCCFKKKGKRKLKFKFSMKRRRSSSAKTPQLEDQTMEKMREMMLDKHDNVNDFLKGAPESSSNPTAVELPGDAGLRRNLSQTDSARTHPSWIGVAVTSSTPPSTAPSPRSNSQRTTKTTQSAATSADYPEALTSGLGPQSNRIHSSPLPKPLRPVYKPPPIITTPSLARPEHVSPLSPRGTFNTISNTTSTAWRRASQALSPGGYQRVDDEPSGAEKSKRRDSKARNPELEIGHQTDRGWNGQWI